MGTSAFRFRKAVEDDLPHCLKLLPSGWPLEPNLKDALLDIWRRLLRAEAKTFAIVEDASLAHPGSIEAFGLSVFVSDSFAEEFLAGPSPYFPIEFYRRVLQGDNIVLSDRELAEANAAEGINVATLHFGLRKEDFSYPRTIEMMPTGGASFFFFHDGYRIKNLFYEVYGADAAQYVLSTGFRIMRDFQKERPEDFASIKAEHYPYLTGLTRQDVPPGAANPVSRLFHPQIPRIGFSRGERLLLEHALLNETDSQIAKGLGVTQHAVKKTWENIYARVAREAPQLMPANHAASGIRGEEKRRHILHHVRTHPEELRAYRR
jgi:DNA-binding CsgD family transcriptional regulator